MKDKFLKNIKAAGYYRLSRDDGDKSESDSITNQKSLISEYAEKNKLSLDDEYVDDGYSGTNFDRPGFIRMMNDIRNGDINCIIIKDFSRLGRNYIEMGKYMTKIFPSMGVRLISINDNYDSLRDNDLSDQIIIPFKNLINDAYCRDISMKIRSQLDIKRKNGQYIASFPLYGYEKDPEDHNHLIIDTVAAEAVQLIFNLKLDGYNQRAIVAKLNELAIPTPLEYRRMRSRDYNNRFSCKGADGQYTNKEYICNPKEYNEKSCGKKVSADYLSIIVNEQLSNYIKLMCDKADDIKKIKTSEDSDSLDNKINSVVIRIKDNKARSLKLYEDYVNGIIDQNDYKLFKDKFSVEELEKKLEALKAEKDEKYRKMESFLSLFDDIKDKLTDGKYGPEIYQALIDKIIVYGDDRLEILFKYNR